MTDAASTATPRQKTRHLPTRFVVAVAFGALFVIVLSPSSAAVAVAFAFVACFGYERFKAKWFLPLAFAAGFFHVIPWYAVALLIFLYLIGIGLTLAVVEIGADVRQERDPFARRAWSVVMFEWVPQGVLILGTLAAGIVTGSWTGLAEAALPTWLAFKRHYFWSFALAVLVIVVFGFSPPLFASLAVTLFAASWSRIALRPPDLRYPLPSAPLTSPVFGLHLWRLDRAIKQGRIDDVSGVVAASARSSSNNVLLDLRRALIALEKRQFQTALDIVGDPATRGRAQREMRLLRASALTAIGHTREAVSLLEAEPGPLRGRLALAYELARAEAHLADGSYVEAHASAERAIGLSGGRRDSGDRFRAHRLAIEALTGQGRLEEAQRASERGLASIGTYWWTKISSQGADADKMLLSARGRQLLELARLIAASERLDIQAGTVKPERRADFAATNDVSMYFAMSGAWQDFADTELLRARLLVEDNELDSAISACLQALRELDRHRYELRSQRDRAAWSRRMSAGLALALEIATKRADTTLVTELLELARVQALPLLTGASNASNVDVDVDVAPAPVIRVRGRTRVARFADPRRPPPVDLELAAMDAAGFGAWSLSFWLANDNFYWSVLPPTGDAYAGTIAAATGSPAVEALEELRSALPAFLDGESPGAFDVRLSRSPLLSDPIAEWRLSTKLAEFLLPEPLRDELRRRAREGAPLLPLAISPAPELGFVPWSLLVVNPVARGRSPSRLVHYADWVLAPAAALSAELSLREQVEGPMPLRLAIVDTWQDNELPALDGARTIAKALPPTIDVLGGRHWCRRAATKHAVLSALTECDRNASAIFACHALRAHNQTPSSSGLVLAASGADEHEAGLLTASDLFGFASAGGSVPAQIYLQACDTSDLASSAAGEWLTIAPGFLVAGAREVCSTIFPLLDSESGADPVVAALTSGQDLRAAVHTLQIDGAACWDALIKPGTARLSDSPLYWAAYAVAAAAQVERAERTAFAESALAGPDGTVSMRMRLALARAAKTVREMHAKRVSTADVMARYLDSETTVTEGSVWRELGVALALPLLARLACRGLRAQPIDEFTATDELVACLRQALIEAKLEGRALEPEHLIRVAIRESSAAQRLLRMLDATRIQRRAQIANLVDLNLAEHLLDQQQLHAGTSPPVSQNFAFVQGLLKAARSPTA